PRAVPHADSADGVGADGPVEYVDVVDVLFDDVVAADPGVVVPVPHLLRDLGGHLRPGRPGPEDALHPEAAPRDDVADLTGVNALDRLDVGGLVAALRAGDDGEVLGLGLVVGLEDFADAGAIGGDGLLGEDVDALGNGGFQVQWSEAGRR